MTLSRFVGPALFRRSATAGLQGEDVEPQTRFDFLALESCGVSLLPISAGPRSLRGQLAVRRTCRRLSPGIMDQMLLRGRFTINPRDTTDTDP